jgi:glycosyltransferase involved in cell wall biosynthesis
MSVYRNDNPGLFDKALGSVFGNTLSPSATVLIIDGPITASLMAVVKKYADRDGFTVHQNEVNKGLAHSLNIGLGMVNTEYVFRADADDINLPERFALQAVELESGADLVGGAILEFDQDGLPGGLRSPPIEHEDIVNYASRRNPFNHMTTAYRTELARACGGYPDLYLREDYGLWALMIQAGARVRNIPDVVVHASAGEGLIKRRGGFKYALGEIELQRHLVRTGIKGSLSGLIHAIMRGAIFAAPVFVRESVYRRFLRTAT